MIPNKPGSYNWVDRKGFVGPKEMVWNVDVVDMGSLTEPWLRVYWNGGYYNVLPDDFSPEGECWPADGWI